MPSVTLGDAAAPFDPRRTDAGPRGADVLTDPTRLRLLGETGLVEASAVALLPTLDRVARLAARATRAPVAQLNLITADAQVPAAAFVDPTQSGPDGELLDPADADLGGSWRSPVGLHASYCQHIVRSGDRCVIDDVATDPATRDDSAMRTGRIGAYAALPVVTPDGVVLGTVCVLEFHARSWTRADVAALEECAALAGEEVAARLGAAAALRDSEERLRLALSAGRLGTWSLDLRSEALTASARCKENFGRAPDDAFSYADLLAAIHPDDRQRVRDAIHHAIATDTDYSVEYAVRLPDHSERWVAAHGHAFYDAHRTPIRMVGVTQDITERRMAEDRVRHARDVAEAASLAKSEFLAVMSHELRTPLNAIDGYAELLEMGVRGPLTDEQRHDIGRIRNSQRHLLGLINGVLNYSRVEAGTVRYDIAAVRVDDALTTCESLTAPQRRLKSLAFRFDAGDRDVCVRADAEKLQQILLNLLTNAVKFTPAGGQIAMGWAVVGDRVRVTVSDTGRGIASEHLDRIFEPFVQVDASRTRTHEGVGLGLAISRDLARGMGGDLTAESTPGVGSTFMLTLRRSM